MDYPDLRRIDGRFADGLLEQKFFADAWPGIRMQAAFTILGFSVAWLLSTNSDLSYLIGTPYFWPPFSLRVLCGVFGLVTGVTMLLSKPAREAQWVRVCVPIWILLSTATAAVVALSFPPNETTPDGLADVLVFTSSWMSLHVMAMGVALAAYANWIALISVTYALTYAFLAIYWNDTSEHPVFSQAVLVWTSCAFAWIMSVAFSMRARRRFYLTELYEKARIAAEQAQEFSTFLLAATGHDIRQPVYALDLNASLLEDLLEAENWEKAKEVAGRQREVVRNVSSLLSSVLELSYLDTDRRPVAREQVAVGDLVREVATPLEEVARGKGVEIRWVSSTRTIEIDRGIVEHILTNLVSNAINHSGGKRVLIGAKRSGEQIELLVVDDGNGIGRDAMTLDSMSVVEQSRKTGLRRAGLGLEIIFRLAEKGRMRMQIHSRPGEGTLARLGQGAS